MEWCYCGLPVGSHQHKRLLDGEKWSQALRAIRRQRDEFSRSQAIRHGHPLWTHSLAYGPCLRKD